MSKQLASLSGKLAARFGMDADEKELIDTLKATAFRQDGNQQITDAQMTAMLIVANQYGLNPWTKEIYAFPHKGSIVPIVGVDGWARIINDHPMFDGMDFQQDDESCTCRIYRKDRSHPVAVTEYMSECYKETPPWKSHKRRMLRHKALIQCARMAFSYSGIYDEDDAERILDRDAPANTGKPEAPAELPPYPADRFDQFLPAWQAAIDTGAKTREEVIATVESKGTLTDEMKARILHRPIEGVAA